MSSSFYESRYESCHELASARVHRTGINIGVEFFRIGKRAFFRKSYGLLNLFLNFRFDLLKFGVRQDALFFQARGKKLKRVAFLVSLDLSTGAVVSGIRH